MGMPVMLSDYNYYNRLFSLISLSTTNCVSVPIKVIENTLHMGNR